MTGWKRAFESQMILLTRREHVVFDHFQAEQIRAVRWNAVIGSDVMLVHHPGVTGRNQRSPVLHIKF